MLIHVPVLPKETIDNLRPRPGGTYVDGTLGLAGHATEILKASAPSGQLIGLDRDDEAIAIARKHLEPFGSRATILHENFSRLDSVLDGLMINTVDGILLDLGPSSMQFERPSRGFSFETEGPLDMRMDRREQTAAFQIVNTWPREDLARLFRAFGEQRSAGRVASSIVKARRNHPIRTTTELSSLVSRAIPADARRGRIHPATRIFLALRSEVNHELRDLETFLEACPNRLRTGGRVCIISFHSLEDRLVKRSFRDHAKGCTCPAGLPWCSCNAESRLQVITTTPIRPSPEEQRLNPRSRSAKLRVAERIDKENHGHSQ